MIKDFFRRYWPQLLLISLSIVLYAHTLRADFLRWDDRQNILLNPWIENWALSLIWTKSYYNLYIPVTYTFWTILWHISNQPWIFHLANLTLHALNTLLVYTLTRRLTKEEQPHWSALFAALVFCSHPLQVETVAWISTGRDLLAAFFALAAANLLFASESTFALASGTLIFILGLLSKPTVAVTPAALLCLAYVGDLWTRRRVTTLMGWFIPGLLASYVTKRIQQLDADLRLPPMDLYHRFLVSLDTLGFYIQKVLIPYPLAADYGRTRELALDGNIWPIVLVGLALLTALSIYFRRKISRQAFAYVALFLLFLAPVSGLIPFQAQFQSTVSDRYAYFPLIAVGLLVGLVFNSNKYWPAMVLVVGVLSGLTLMRAEVWQTNEIFFTDMLAKNEKSHVALSSLGVEYILTNRLQEAEGVLNRATVLKPMDIVPRTNLAQLYLLFNRPDRVVSEIVPLLEDREFLRINQTETRALASAYRLSARAFWTLSLWSRANQYFCRWFQLDFENMDGRAEIMRFIEDAKKHQVNLPNCEVPISN